MNSLQTGSYVSCLSGQMVLGTWIVYKTDVKYAYICRNGHETKLFKCLDSHNCTKRIFRVQVARQMYSTLIWRLATNDEIQKAVERSTIATVKQQLVEFIDGASLEQLVKLKIKADSL